MDKCLVSLLVKADTRLNLLVEFAKGLEDFEPVQVGVVLAEGAGEVIGISLPLEDLRFVDWLLL